MTQDTEAIRDISADVLRRYLAMHGWTARSFTERKLVLFTLPAEAGDDEIEIVVPTAMDRERALPSIRAALETLSQIEERPLVDLAMDIRSIAFDIIRSRVPDEYVRQDTIELKLAAEFIESMRALLGSTATTELAPGKYFGRTRKEASDYASRCRFGHTFRGSFGFVVESPVGLNDEPTMAGVPQEVPFARRVVQRLARGLDAVQRAAKQDDPSPITQEYQAGLSANMCDDLIDLVERTGLAKLRIGIDLSPEWQAPDGLQNQSEFSVEIRHVDLLRAAARTLRADEVKRPAHVVGRIRTLETEGNPADLLQDNSDREIIVNWDSQDHGLIRVRIYLAPEDYLSAVEAHKAGRFISVRGILEHRGRTWTLAAPMDFSVLPGE